MLIGIPGEYSENSVHPDIKNKISDMVKFLKQNDFSVVDVSLPLTEKCISVYYIFTIQSLVYHR